MTSPSADSEQTADVPVTAARVLPPGEPLLPKRSYKDSDAAWGEYREPADDRLYRDRPPHWADF